jgi:sugar-specific transcriptional regulator TrmB
MQKIALAEMFKRLGLGKHAAHVYQVIAEKGPLLASHVILYSKRHRPAVYKALHELNEHSLICSMSTGKRKLWNVTDRDRVEKLFQNISVIVPAVQSRMPVRFLQGSAGIRSVFDDVVEHAQKGETFYRFTSETDLDAVNAYLSKDYRKKRDQKKLERQVISNPLSGNRKQPRLERFIKFIPPEIDVFNQNIIELVYGSRIAFIDLNKKECFIIENSSLADFQKVIFRQLYKRLK